MLSDAARLGATAEPSRHPDALEALRAIHDPCSVATGVPINIVDMGLIGTVRRDGRHLQVGLCLTSTVCLQAAGLVHAVESALTRLPDVDTVTCEVDVSRDWTPDRLAGVARAQLRQRRPHAALERGDRRSATSTTARQPSRGAA
jgi:metal-sulfur cluster biosynthetic enzyme